MYRYLFQAIFGLIVLSPSWIFSGSVPPLPNSVWSGWTNSMKTATFAEAQSMMSFLVDGTWMTNDEYVSEYVTIYEYNLETKKFKVHRCKQEKSLVAKGHKLREITSNVQWLECQECGAILRGHGKATQHVIRRGHTRFMRIYFDKSMK